MHLSISGLVVAIASAAIVASSCLPANEVAAESSQLTKRGGYGGNRGHGGSSRERGHSGSSRGRVGNRRGYYQNGRYWFWDENCDSEFLGTLRYRPSRYYSQRFQYLYLYMENFRSSWNSNMVFRNRWESDDGFRQNWFGQIQYNGWNEVGCDDGNNCGSIGPGSGY
ncbi:hypothetical protein BB560_002809 [Smittium megazygosporum]|uniref:Uncharacterized protein n=1 Tax=Smittium megazygosporum TaxID=133381 RepID=A0A2T9ZDS4_9FUNG|nr:hypothetical protein BB560_002809 [Smittium megazygosporum]